MSGERKETSSVVSELAPTLLGHMPELRPVVVRSGLGRSFCSLRESAFTLSLSLAYDAIRDLRPMFGSTPFNTAEQ